MDSFIVKCVSVKKRNTEEPSGDYDMTFYCANAISAVEMYPEYALHLPLINFNSVNVAFPL